MISWAATQPTNQLKFHFLFDLLKAKICELAMIYGFVILHANLN